MVLEELPGGDLAQGPVLLSRRANVGHGFSGTPGDIYWACIINWMILHVDAQLHTIYIIIYIWFVLVWKWFVYPSNAEFIWRNHMCLWNLDVLGGRLFSDKPIWPSACIFSGQAGQVLLYIHRWEPQKGQRGEKPKAKDLKNRSDDLHGWKPVSQGFPSGCTKSLHMDDGFKMSFQESFHSDRLSFMPLLLNATVVESPPDI